MPAAGRFLVGVVPPCEAFANTLTAADRRVLGNSFLLGGGVAALAAAGRGVLGVGLASAVRRSCCDCGAGSVCAWREPLVYKLVGNFLCTVS